MTEPSRITEYLADKYGEEMAGQARIEYDHGGLSEARYYKIYTPVLPDGEYFELYYDPIHNKNQRMQDDLMNRFISVNSFYTSDYEEYIYGKNIIPDDITLIERNLLSIDFKDYQHGDDYTALFNRTIYDIKMISVDANDDSEETINQIIDKIWSNEYLRYAAKNTYYSFVIEVNVLGEEKSKITIFARSVHAKATAHIYENGSIIASRKLELD